MKIILQIIVLATFFYFIYVLNWIFTPKIEPGKDGWVTLRPHWILKFTIGISTFLGYYIIYRILFLDLSGNANAVLSRFFSVLWLIAACVSVLVTIRYSFGSEYRWRGEEIHVRGRFEASRGFRMSDAWWMGRAPGGGVGVKFVDGSELFLPPMYEGQNELVAAIAAVIAKRDGRNT